MTKINELYDEIKALGITAKTLVDGIINVQAGRREKSVKFPAGDPQYQLGYETCLQELHLRFEEVLATARDTLGRFDLPTDEDLAPPVMISVRTGNTGAPDYKSIYSDVPSKWNEIEVGQFYRKHGGAVGKIAAKDRAARTITVQWNAYYPNPSDQNEVIEAGSHRIEDQGAFTQVKLNKRTREWVEVKATRQEPTA